MLKSKEKYLTLSLGSIFVEPTNHSTGISSYESSQSKVAVSPAVTVTSRRGRRRPIVRALEEEKAIFNNAKKQSYYYKLSLCSVTRLQFASLKYYSLFQFITQGSASLTYWDSLHCLWSDKLTGMFQLCQSLPPSPDKEWGF